MYSIKAVSQITGLSVEIIRAWERRYKAVEPERDHNQRRVYRNEEVKRLHLLKKATERGHPISQVVQYGDDELQKLVATSPLENEQSRYNNKLLQDLFNCVDNYDVVGCDNVLGLAMRSMSPLELIQDFLSPALIEIGERWHRGETTVANERILSSGVRRLLISVMHTYQKTSRGKALVFGTLSGEHHEIGSLFCAFITASLGFNCYYLGPNLPAEDYVRMAEKTTVDVILISVVSLLDDNPYAEMLRYLSTHLNPKTQIWIGGRGGKQLLNHQQLPKRCVLIHDIADFQQKLEGLNRSG